MKIQIFNGGGREVLHFRSTAWFLNRTGMEVLMKKKWDPQRKER